LIRDARGLLNDCPSIRGTIVDAHTSASSRYFVVAGQHGEHDFVFDSGLIWRDDCPIGRGSRVQVHFEDGGLGARRAVKVKCLRGARR
jgi:hypothetical protein